MHSVSYISLSFFFPTARHEMLETVGVDTLMLTNRIILVIILKKKSFCIKKSVLYQKKMNPISKEIQKNISNVK